MIENPESIIYKPNFKKEEQHKTDETNKKTSKKKKAKQQIGNNLLPLVTEILEKNLDARNHADNMVLHKYIESQNSVFLTQIAELTNIEVAKNLLKAAHIHQMAKNRTLVNSGSQITRVIIILQGTFGVVEDSDNGNKNQEEISYKQVIENILTNCPTLLREAKRKWKSNRDDPKALAQFKTIKANLFQLTINKYYKEQNVFNIRALQNGKRYTETLVSCSPGKIMSLSLKTFLQVLANYVKIQKANKISVFRKLSFFNSFDNQKLLHMVDELPIITKMKKQEILSEGEPCEDFYILLKGSIKLKKTVSMFKENPNILYKDRASLNEERLDYADFSQVYNYKPRTKLVELGIISALCIFGEEQIVCNLQQRQITVQVSSQQAAFYKININWLEDLMCERKSFLEDFKNFFMATQTARKIKHRQEKLADILLLENKNNMDYFYLQDQKPLSNKFKISKINNFITTPTKKIYSTPRQNNNYHAFYNTFNFTELKKPQPLTVRKQKNRSSQNLTSDQFKIMQLIHGTGLSQSERPSQRQQQQNRSLRTSRKVSQKVDIDIFHPLFSVSYFEKNQKESLRIEKQSRRRPLSTNNTNRSLSRKYTINK